MRDSIDNRAGSPTISVGAGAIAGSSRPHVSVQGQSRASRDFVAPGWTVRRMTFAVLAVGVAWRVLRYALAFPLWGDEAFLAVNFFTRDFAGLSRPLDFGQVAPPGFLWAELAIVRLMGASEWALRLVPFAAGIASLGLFWRYCRGVATARTTLVAVAILAASLYPARHANEVKPYATDLLISLGLTVLGWGVWREPGRMGRWVALIALVVAGVWCSYTAVFPAFAVGLLLASRSVRDRSPRVVAGTVLYGLASGASWAAMMLVFARPQMAETSWLSSIWSEGFPPLSRPWRLPGWLLSVHTGNMMSYPVGGMNFGSTATFLLVVIGAVAMFRRKARRPLLLLLLGPLVAAFVAAAMGRYPYGVSARVSLYMAPAFCLLAAEGVMVLLKRQGRAQRGPLRLAAILAMVPIVAACADIARPSYRESEDYDFRALARRLAKESRPGDRWIVFDGADPLPRTFDVMVSKWVQRVAMLRINLLAHAPSPPEWEPEPGGLAPIKEGRTWLILHDHGCKPLYRRDRREAFERVARERLGAMEWARVKTSSGSRIDVLVSEPASR